MFSLSLCVCSILWFVCGFRVRLFPAAGPWLGDSSAALLRGLSRGAPHPGLAIPESVYVMFEMTFAIITPALIVGGLVERIRSGAVLLISGLWLLLVYVPVAHWVWGGGWPARRGAMDFAGGIVVHVTAGVSALVIAVLLGARSEFPHGIRPPHAPWMVMVGASLAVGGMHRRQRTGRRRGRRNGPAGNASVRRIRHPDMDGD